jgi:hypothetical protein
LEHGLGELALRLSPGLALERQPGHGNVFWGR